jgi:hypothetical protein
MAVATGPQHHTCPRHRPATSHNIRVSSTDLCNSMIQRRLVVIVPNAIQASCLRPPSPSPCPKFDQFVLTVSKLKCIPSPYWSHKDPWVGLSAGRYSASRPCQVLSSNDSGTWALTAGCGTFQHMHNKCLADMEKHSIGSKSIPRVRNAV